MNKLLFCYILISQCLVLKAQNILIDESYEDWDDIEFKIIDSGDSNNLDFQLLQVTNDADYIYFRLKLNNIINLQNDNNIKLAIDSDNDSSTGSKIYDIGAEFIYEFGRRVGSLGDSNTIFHNDIGLISLPTVTSDEFEIAIERNINNGSIYLEGDIKYHFYTSPNSGDVIPNVNGINSFSFNEEIKSSIGISQIHKINSTDLRILSYNVLRDNIFNSTLAKEYERILSSINADIMCFQEIYDHSAEQLLSHLVTLNVISDNESWFSVKDGRDLITISKYPIVYHQEVDGNSAVEIQTANGPMLILNCHLPCCENDSGRVSEIDELLSFLSGSLEGETNVQLAEGTPYIILGDMNFVGDASQVHSLITGDIISNFIYGPDIRMDYGDGAITDSKPITTGFPASFTWYNNQSSFPSGRLDYLLFTDSVLKKSNSFVLNTKGLSQTLLTDFNLLDTDTERASDHFPLVVDFEQEQSTSIALNSMVQNLWYPNPTNSILNLQSSVGIENIIIYNQRGQKQEAFINTNNGTIEIDFSWSSPGIYFIHYQQGNVAKVSKVVIK